ncbi:hypothetical protein D0O09_31885, partial [Pseudomonas putida]
MRRSPIRFAEKFPHKFIQALLSAEDDKFPQNHYGVDPSSLMRAANPAGEKNRPHPDRRQHHHHAGGERNFFLTSERSFSRKDQTKILLALQIERELTKDEILELYVNKIYLGNRA